MSLKLVSRLLAALLMLVTVLVLVPQAHGKRVGPLFIKLTGILTAKGDDWIALQADGETDTKRYALCPPDGGADRATHNALAKLIVNSRVQLTWTSQDPPRLLSVIPVPPAAKSGVVEGVLTAKGDTWIEILPKKGKYAERYTPQWIGGLAKNGGGFDKDILQVFTELNPGDQVGVKWLFDGQQRVVEIWQL